MLNIRNMDCMNLMKEYPDKYFELAIVDPPYGIGNFNQSDSKQGNIIWNNHIPSEEYFNELYRVSKKQIIWGANYYNCFSPVEQLCGTRDPVRTVIQSVK